MTKFKVLKYNQSLMAKLGIHSYDLIEPKNEFFRSPAAFCIVSILCIFSITSTGFYAFKIIEQFDAALQAIFVLIAGIQCLGMYIAVGLKKRQVKDVQLKLQHIVDEVTETEILNRYWRNEQKCRKFTKILAINYIIMLAIMFIGLFIYSLYLVFVGASVASALRLPYYMDVPFAHGSEATWGWYLLWFIQCMMSFSYAMCVLSTTSYFVCCCIYMDAICQQFELLMASIANDVEQMQRTETMSMHMRLWQMAQKNLHQAIEIHVKVYEIFALVADIFNGAIFSLLPINAIFTGICFYGMEHSDRNVVSFALTFLYIVTSSVWPYLFCFCATHATDRVASIGDVAYNSSWYDYPLEWRQYVTMIIARSQQPINFSGFNLITCNLNTFLVILKSSCSYYLIFRRFTHQ